MWNIVHQRGLTSAILYINDKQKLKTTIKEHTSEIKYGYETTDLANT